MLEDAGLSKDREYKREDAFKNSDKEIRRPDFVLYLPEDKHIIIDSKVSLGDYNASVNAEDEEESQNYLQQHVKCIRNHISDLADKNYTSLIGINSPDFVFMFMPIETAYLAAFDADRDLFEFAYKKRIAVVTPNTLLPILRTVASLWNVERQNKSTKQIAEAAGKIYDKLRIFCDKFEKVEAQLHTVNKSYDDARKTLTGPRSLISLAEGFKELGVKVNKSLPENMIDESRSEIAQLDSDVAPTSIVNEPTIE